MKKLFSFLLLNFVVYVLQAQIQDPVKFKTELKSLSDTEAEIVFTATIDKGWHVYSTELGDGGPISATFNVDSKSGIEPVGKLKPVGKEIAAFDKLFEMKVRYFENTAKFIQKVKEGQKQPKTCMCKCIKTCDISKSPYCIIAALYNAFKGNMDNGYAFAGANAFRATKIVSVKETFRSLLDEFNRAINK